MAPGSGGALHPDLEKLIVLQRLDLELRSLRDEIDALPARVAALAATSAQAQAGQLTLEESIAREDKLRRSQESDIKGQNDRSARLRRQMDAVTNTTQATALEHQISFIAAEISRIEDLELDSMARSEFFEAELPKAKTAVLTAQTALERERLRGADRIADVQARLATLDRDRIALRQSVGDAMLTTYDRIRKTRGTALAEGVDGKCSACQMMVRPQSWQDLRDRSRHDVVMTCDTCGRLLYWDPARDAPQKKPADREESIAARIVRSL